MTTSFDAPTVNRSVMSKDLIGRIQAHLETAIGAVVEITPRGKGSVTVRFAEPITTYPMDAKFAPLLLNWSMTQSAADGAIYLNVPAAWRQEGEGTVKKLTAPQQRIIGANRPGETLYSGTRSGVDPSIRALLRNGHLIVSEIGTYGTTYTIQDTPEVRACNAAYAPIPLTPSTEPIPVNELENADEPCGDVGTLIDPKPANNLPDVQPSRPVAAFRSPNSALTSKTSPLRDQYLTLKANYPDHLMFFRLGDFYELFDHDAEIAALELDLVLTSRPIGGNSKDRVPMCGVPHHALDLYTDRIRRAGYAVVIVEQASEPNGRGLVERRVDRVLDRIRAITEPSDAPAKKVIEISEPEQPADPTAIITFEAMGKEGERLHPAPCGYPEYLCSCGIGGDDNADPSPEPEQSADPIYQDYIGELLRAGDWVQTPSGLKGAIAGFKQDRMAVVALMSEFKQFDASTDIHDYLVHTLRRIDPPAPKDDPINYDAYNGGLADAALNALVQNDIERVTAVQPADPTAWATDVKRAEVSAFLEAKNFYPAELKPTSTKGVWLVEDYRRAEKFKARLEKIGVEIVGKVIPDWMGDEPYAVAEIRLPEGALESVSEDYRPYPSGRRTKPAPIPNSLYARYDQLHETLPAAALLLIQANAEDWNAYTIDAALLRRYAPLCRFAAQVVSERGEKWDALTVPAGVVDELLDLAKEGGLTVALAPIVRDEPPALPAREVTEIHAPGEPVQYVGREEAPEADDEPEPVSPAVTPKLDMTPERVAAKIRLRIEGGLRLGRVCAVTPDRLLDGTFVVRFMHPVNEFVLDALHAAYDETHAVDEDRFCVSLRPKSAAAHGDVFDQAAAVIAQTPALPDAPVLLSEINELQLMDELRFDHPALYEAAPGVVSFLLNVIAALRAERLASVVEHS